MIRQAIVGIPRRPLIKNYCLLVYWTKDNIVDYMYQIINQFKLNNPPYFKMEILEYGVEITVARFMLDEEKYKTMLNMLKSNFDKWEGKLQFIFADENNKNILQYPTVTVPPISQFVPKLS